MGDLEPIYLIAAPLAIVGVTLISAWIAGGTLTLRGRTIARMESPRLYWSLVSLRVAGIVGFLGLVAMFVTLPPSSPWITRAFLIGFALAAFRAGHDLARALVDKEVRLYGRRFGRESDPASYWFFVTSLAGWILMALPVAYMFGRVWG